MPPEDGGGSSSDEGELPEGDVARRVVFDIGSGTTRCVVADVDVEADAVISIVSAEAVTVSYGLDSAQNEHGELSERAQQRGLQVLTSCARRAADLGATASAALLTGVFRTAPNGGECAARIKRELGLDVGVAAVDDEARLGLPTARALGGAGSGVVVWQQGSGAIVSAGDTEREGGLTTHACPVGLDAARRACAELQGGGAPVAPSPVTAEQAAALVRQLWTQHPPAPAWLVGAEGVTAIGGEGSPFAVAAALAEGAGAAGG